ncbi:MAG: glycoside hydrolase family 25 protein [Methyloligellaceae bacterium]
MRFILGFGLLFVFLNFVILGLAYVYYLNFEPPKSRFPIQGIDVSHHQGIIDWDAVKSAGVTFAFMKATEGGDHKDTRFKTNWQAAARADIHRGAYHFFTFCRPGRDQAQNFIDSVPVSAASLPPAVDLEFGGNCKKKPDAVDLKKELGVFLERLKSHYRRQPILYMTQEFFEAYYDKLDLKNPLWVRSLLFEPKFAKKEWIFWQYHNRGRKEGVSGAVDLNVFRWDKGRFQGLLRPQSP